MKKFEIKASGRRAEVLLYDRIGFGWEGGISAKRFAEELNALGKLDEITVRINCPGGDPMEGMVIYNVLARNSARVKVEIDGVAGEIGAVIAMAGNSIKMASNAFMMVGPPGAVVAGTANDLREMANRLEKVRGNAHDIFVKRTNRPKHVVSDWMKGSGTWFTAKEALAAGLTGEITTEAKITNFAGLDLTRAKNTPKALVSRIEQGRAATSFGDPLRQKIAGLKNRILKISLRQSGRKISSPTRRK